MTLSATARRRLDLRFGSKGPYALLALVAYIPLLFTKWDVVSADTKVYLYLDPGRLLRDAVSMWDPNTALGTVPHQQIGYLFPMGPYYWIMREIGLPVWLAQRLWLGTVLFAAGAGMIYLLRTLRWRGPGVVAAAFVYMLSPYLLDYAAKHSVVAVPWAGLPWLVAFAIRAVRHRGWRDPALFAITVQLIGGVNATSLALVLVAALLWFPFAVWVHREATMRTALGAMGRIGVLTLVTSLWWISGLWAQGRYGINVVQYTETAKTVASASTAPEVLRGLGYWFFYGTDKFGNFVDAGVPYTQHPWLLFISFLLPAISVFGGAIARFRERAYFVCVLLVGMILSVGAYPWSGGSPVASGLRWFVTSSQAGGALRSLPRAVPLVVLGLSALLGAGITALHERVAERTNTLDWRVVGVAGVVGVLALVNFPALFDGELIASGLQRPENVPSYWRQDGKALTAGGSSTRVLALPGSDFASYRWNGKVATTVDPITPGLTTRPFVAREQVPYGTPPSANLLDAFDTRLQQGTLDPRALAPIARLMNAGVLNVRSDLTWERYGLIRPKEMWQLVQAAPGLGSPQAFGGPAPTTTDPRFPMLDETALELPTNAPDPPKLAIVPVNGTPSIVHAHPISSPLVVDGDGNGLVDAAEAGLLSGQELVLYAGSFAKDPKALRQAISSGGALLVTDSNRKAAQRWGDLNNVYGYTEEAGEHPLVNDPSDQRLDVFPGAGDNTKTVAQQRGGVEAEATGYGNPIDYTPEDRADNAVDGNPQTAWEVGGFGPVEDEKLELNFAAARTTDYLRLLQIQTGVRNRFITKVRLSFDGPSGRSSVTADLTDASRTSPGQIVRFPSRTFNKVTIEIIGDTAGKRPSYQGLTPVGFAEVQAGDASPKDDEVIRLPTDLLQNTGAASQSHPLDVLLTRQRVSPSDAVRSDPELSIERTWSLPTSRSFAVSGTARVSQVADPAVVDRVVGLPDAAHGGVDVSESRHLAGDLADRATAAIDGAPATYWSTGFLSAVGDWAQYHVSDPLMFDRLGLQVVADGKHSVPTSIRVDAGGQHVDVSLPPIADRAQPNSVVNVPVRLPHSLTGNTIRFTITGTRAVDTNDWYSEKPVSTPVAIADWGVPGLHVQQPPAQLSSACQSGLLTINGHDVPVALRGTTANALAGDPITFTACTGSGGVAMRSGSQLLRATPGGETGISLDQISLRSAAGGRASASTGYLVPIAPPTHARVVGVADRKPASTITANAKPRSGATSVVAKPATAASPTLQVVHHSNTSIDIKVTGATGPFWMVLGQSFDRGWHASVRGHDLGTTTLVDGYANGWRVDPRGTSSFTVHLRWTPQRVVWVALVVSLLGMILCLFLVLLPMRRRMAPVGSNGARTLEPDPSVPRSLSAVRSLRYGGPEPSWGEASGVAVAMGLLAGLVVSPWAGIAAATLTLLGARVRKARPVFTFGSVACVLACGAYYVWFQAAHHVAVDFNWPDLLARVNQVAWMAVILLVIDVVLDRLWLRRWWPTEDSPA